ncbi:thioredoxin trx1 [Entomophthora muscae]|uniref:Thioredoxin trx1 n=1 Tax=Entomophthora muscae TaxID=34485 RepID=A0ACC2RIY1_9FUNG|nr:thioredoxin trx1 [Entomophthora muscae]
MAFQAHDIVTLQTVLRDHRSVVILFNDGSILTNFAVEPEFDLMSKQSDRIFFVKVDLNEVPEAQVLAAQNGLATVNFYKHGCLTHSIPGFNLEMVKGALLQKTV